MSEILLIVGVQNDTFDWGIRLTWPAAINSERHWGIILHQYMDSKTCTHLHLYTHTHKHARTHVYTHTHTHRGTHTYTHSQTHTHTHTHTQTHTHTHTHIYILAICCTYTCRQRGEKEGILVETSHTRSWFQINQILNQSLLLSN